MARRGRIPVQGKGVWVWQVVYGGIAALGGALLCSTTRIWNNGLKRVVVVLFTGLAFMWLGLQYGPCLPLP